MQWTNTDATKWTSDYWELAKCYLPYGYDATRNETEADLSGLLSLIINCKDVDNYLTAKVDPDKNDLYHKVCSTSQGLLVKDIDNPELSIIFNMQNFILRVLAIRLVKW